MAPADAFVIRADPAGRRLAEVWHGGGRRPVALRQVQGRIAALPARPAADHLMPPPRAPREA